MFPFSFLLSFSLPSARKKEKRENLSKNTLLTSWGGKPDEGFLTEFDALFPSSFLLSSFEENKKRKSVKKHFVEHASTGGEECGKMDKGRLTYFNAGTVA